MSASRSSSIRVLKQLASSSHGTTQIRRLHMLDPAVFPATKKKPSIAKVSASPAVEKTSEVTGTVRQDHSASSLSSPSNPISTPTHSTGTQAAKGPADAAFQNRHFTTTRNLGASRDSSSIDFAYLPQVSTEDPVTQLRVPLTPWNFETTSQSSVEHELEPAVHRATISTAAGEATHISVPSAMSETVDSTSGSFDIHEFASTITSAVKTGVDSSTQQLGEQAQRAQGVVKRVWTDMIDDVFGGSTSRSRA